MTTPESGSTSATSLGTDRVTAAGAHYATRNAAFAARLTALGVPAAAGDGLNLWVPLPVPARDVSEHLMRRGWLVRTGDEFSLADASAVRRLRLTVHDLADADADRLAGDVAAAVGAAGGRLVDAGME